VGYTISTVIKNENLKNSQSREMHFHKHIQYFRLVTYDFGGDLLISVMITVYREKHCDVMKIHITV